MICPLLMMAVTTNAGYVSSEKYELHTSCIAKECGWWDKKKGQCAILTLAQKDNSKVSIAR